MAGKISEEKAKREQLRKHIAAIDGRRPQEGHSERGFATCPHPDCMMVHPAERLSRRAEELYEAIGGDLCICQRADVPHWCEKCRARIALIASAVTQEPLRLLVDAIRDYFSYSPSRRTEAHGRALDSAVYAAEARLSQASSEPPSINAVDPVDRIVAPGATRGSKGI